MPLGPAQGVNGKRIHPRRGKPPGRQTKISDQPSTVFGELPHDNVFMEKSGVCAERWLPRCKSAKS